MWTIRAIIAAGAAVAAGLLAAPGAADDRATIPPPVEIEKAEGSLKELFKAEYAKAKPAERAAFAAKLYKQALETKDDPAARFVMLRDARDLAAKAGDGITAMSAANELVQSFDVNPGEARVPVVEPLQNAITNTASAKAAAEVLLYMAEDARAADEYGAAATILRGALSAAQRGASGPLGKQASKGLAEVNAILAEGEKLKAEQETLKTKPDDPPANLAVGRYLFAVRQEWDEGVTRLAKGSDAKLKEAAEQDQIATAKATEADELLAADLWYDLATSADATMKPAAQIRAHYWYARALGSATGLAKAKAEKRLAELQKVVDERADHSKLFSGIRQAVYANRVKRWQIVGGSFAKDEFDEGPPGGGLLIGFRYTTQFDGRFPGTMQAIYLTSRGEVNGAVWGQDKGKPEVTKARPGYAVGAIYVRGGGGFDQFKPIYMRITDTGLDPKDSYEGPKVGGMGGGEGTVGGDGSFVVGIHGKVGNNKKMEALSVITLTGELPGPKKPTPRPKN